MREMSLNEVASDEIAGLSSGRVLPLLLVMFVGSGCAALIYEVVWFQLLELVIGSSTVSLGILLGTFMATATSSTEQDLVRGRRTEIDSLNGYVARRGQDLGVPTPVNAALHALVKLVESG